VNERITVTIHHLVASLDAFAEEFLQARHGVSFSTFHFLAAVADVEPVDITSLAMCLGVSKAAVSKRVPALVADGWITTSADPHHARKVLVSLTPRAVELVRDAGGTLDAEFTSVFTDQRLAADGVDVARLNHQLHLLTTLVEEKGSLT
jgi:DNA-binding MarR family transcriptional regulator